MYHKDFDNWNRVKKRIHADVTSISIRAGEVRWIACGINVGTEIDGKGTAFTRPALVIHVVGSVLALVVPISTKVKRFAGYIPFHFQETTMPLCIHQMRVISQRRILARMGKISDNRLVLVKEQIRKFFSL